MPSADKTAESGSPPQEPSPSQWTVYILECADKSLYTGITNDMERRLDAHRTGKGAIYTKTRSPLLLRYTEYHDSKGSALSREAAIKSLTRSAKLALIAAQPRPAQVNK